MSDSFNKMYEVVHPKLGPMVCALTGACNLIGPWLEAIAEHGFAAVPVNGTDDDCSVSGLFIDKDGECWVASSDGGYYHIGKNPVALGSGCSTATYLLGKGKNALYTVKEICATNLFCGGDIKVYNANTGKVTIYEAES